MMGSPAKAFDGRPNFRIKEMTQMIGSQRFGSVLMVIAALGACLTPALVAAPAATHHGKRFAQKLVEET